jgi:uncharacterized membrane protein (UPF0127 family)
LKPASNRRTRTGAAWALGAALMVALLAAGRWLPAGSAIQVVHVDGHPIRVEIADDVHEWTRGLMHRSDLPADAGMLFVYPRPQPLSFWMKDTPLDLDIGFFDAQRRLLNVEAMTAFDATSRHYSRGAAQYALEARRGWFAARDIRPGAILRLPPTLPQR